MARLLWHLTFTLTIVEIVSALNGERSANLPVVYTAGKSASIPGGITDNRLAEATYQYTGLGTSEVNLYFPTNNSIIFSPAYSSAGVGYASTWDLGETWTQIVPSKQQTREQPRMQYADNKWYFWSSNSPGLYLQTSPDAGKANSWSEPLQSSHFDSEISDWAKLIRGKPVRSQLTNGAKDILYLSAPSLISTPIPVQPIGPKKQLILKSTDGGTSWFPTKGAPTLNPLLSGGACKGLTQSLAGQELIIWGDGLVTPNGTIIFGIRRCQSLSVAISYDEGDSWDFVDVPGSHLVPFIAGDLTYLVDGNVLVSTPISRNHDGTLYTTWVDSQYVLKMSKSSDGGYSWAAPLVISVPNDLPGSNSTIQAYHPKIRHHGTQDGRALLAYYGSFDKGQTYHGYIAESLNIGADAPVFTSVIGNKLSQPLQQNQIAAWDQGYGDPFWDLVEYLDVRYVPGSDDIVAGFARRMCSAPSQPPQTYPTSSCVEGWNYTGMGQSAWQGLLVSLKHLS